MVNNGWHNKIINHDVTKPFPLDDGCIDVVVTSPPYWGLRDYGAEGQIGLEQHPQMYIDKLVGVCREIRRVLKKSGSFYLNLGDTYCGGGNWRTDKDGDKLLIAGQNKGAGGRVDVVSKIAGTSNWLQPKQLMLIPMRVAIALQDDGWILRNDIIWHKPNPMPSSVKDRLNNTFEHVFHFVKCRKYFYNLDSIREPHKSVNDLIKRKNKFWTEDISTGGSGKQNCGRSREDFYSDKGKNPGDVLSYKESEERTNYEKGILGQAGRNTYYLNKDNKLCVPHYEVHPKGRNPGDFWNVCTQPFTSYNAELEHFAVFPEELIVKPLKASCPKGGVVLDPFCGRGTVGKVAKDLGLNFVLFDIKPEYCELARLYVNGQKRKLVKYQNKLDFEEN